MLRNMGIRTPWLWVLVKGWCCLGCLEQERIALLQFKANFNYPNGTSLPSWDQERTANCCQWEGIECNTTTNRVVQLSLNNTRDYWKSGKWYFNGTLFLPFEELRTLDLSETGLAGWVENEGFEALSKLSNLEVLDLSFNYFNDSLLSSLSGLSSLKHLSLEAFAGWSSDFNYFGSLSGLSNLEFLDLSDNSLNNSVQSFLKLDDFISLKELYLSENQIKSFESFQGFEALSRLSNLEVFDLSYNSFNDSVLSSLSGLLSLKHLSLQGSLWLGYFNSKSAITFGFGRLTGLSNLEFLDLSYNNLNNSIQSFLRKLSYISKNFLLHWSEIKNQNQYLEIKLRFAYLNKGQKIPILECKLILTSLYLLQR